MEKIFRMMSYQWEIVQLESILTIVMHNSAVDPQLVNICICDLKAGRALLHLQAMSNWRELWALWKMTTESDWDNAMSNWVSGLFSMTVFSFISKLYAKHKL